MLGRGQCRLLWELGRTKPGEWKDWKPDGPCPKDYLYGMAVLELWDMEAWTFQQLAGKSRKNCDLKDLCQT